MQSNMQVIYIRAGLGIYIYGAPKGKLETVLAYTLEAVAPDSLTEKLLTGTLSHNQIKTETFSSSK